ncbi:MAG: phage terminase large subunit [Rickettsiales bacterium]|nr:phage terminase large subunit [Rickettsiales bacterium]
MFKMGEALLQHQLLALEAQAMQSSFLAFLHNAFMSLNGGATYHENWHIEVLATYLQAVESGAIRRLIINMPPRYLKSLTVSVAWPAWLLGQDPARRVIVASYAERLSLKHSLDCRHLLGEAWFKRAYPQLEIFTGQNEKHKFVTTHHGFRLAASVGGALTGEGGNILIIDDPINPLNAESKVARDKVNRWFEHTFSSRLNDKRHGAIVLVMQRVHEEDLTGYLRKKGGWEVLELPALAPQTQFYNHHLRREGEVLHPAREDLMQLEKVKYEMGSQSFSAQYQQRPRPRDGSMIRRSWLLYDDVPPTGGQIVQSWDTAIKAGQNNDPSVCITAQLVQGECHILEVLCERLEYHHLRAALLARAEKWQPDAILIEDKASGQSLLQDLRADTNLPLVPIMPKQDKLTRFAAVTPMIESGRMILPTQALWLADFEHELLSFPASAHDDQVDALSQLLSWWKRRENKGKMGVRRV